MCGIEHLENDITVQCQTECDSYYTETKMYIVTGGVLHVKLRGQCRLKRTDTGWMIGGSSPGRCWEFLSSPSHPDQFWGPPSLLANAHQGLFLWG